MSTYGTAVVLDVPPGSAVGPVLEALFAKPADVYRSEVAAGWIRLTVWMEEIEQVTFIEGLLASAGTARAAVAEDLDEFGVLWVVLAARDGQVSTVHRRYLLNADPNDADEVSEALLDLDLVDPREQDVAGTEAAAAAAELFDTDAAALREAEEKSASAHEQIGAVGGPFPWWYALGLAWPGSEAGESVAPRPTARIRRMNIAVWRRFSRHVQPRFLEPDRWRLVKHGAVREPTTWLAHGVAWEPSSEESFYGRMFIVPLYVPDGAGARLASNYGHRLMNPNGGWSFDLPQPETMEAVGADLATAVETQGPAVLNHGASLERFAEWLHQLDVAQAAEGRPSQMRAEHLAYAWVLLGRYSDAIRSLVEAARVEVGAPEWQAQIWKRAAHIVQLLRESPEAAVTQLDAWADQSAAKIGISRIPSSTSRGSA